MSAAQKLIALSEFDRGMVLDNIGGLAFTVKGGRPLDADRLPAPSFVYETAARALGVSDGLVCVPTKAEVEAAQAEAAAWEQAVSGSPFASGQWNLTHQIELQKSDPDLAARLQSHAAAGTPGGNLTAQIVAGLGADRAA